MSSMALRIIALVTMLLDHIGYVFHANMPDWLYITLRLTGRLAMPIFCFLIAEGLFHTRNTVRYLIRLSAFAVLSEIPFDLAFRGSLWHTGGQNVFVTLALGLISIAVFDRMVGAGLGKAAIFAPILCAVAAEWLRTDYGLFGVYFVFVFYACRTRTRSLIAAFAVGVLALAVAQYASSGLLFAQITLMEMGALAFILRYNGKPGGRREAAAEPSSSETQGKTSDPRANLRRTKKTPAALALQFAFYAFYPAHLLVLYAIHNIL